MLKNIKKTGRRFSVLLKIFVSQLSDFSSKMQETAKKTGTDYTKTSICVVSRLCAQQNSQKVGLTFWEFINIINTRVTFKGKSI